MMRQSSNPDSAPIARRLLGYGRAVVDAVLPPRCLSCGVEVDRQGAICGDCWAGLDFVTDPMCAVCGLPFDVDAPEETICGACVKSPPIYATHRTLWVYGGTAKRLILGLKHADRTHVASALGGWLARIGRPVLEQADLIAPVPLHKWRLLSRRYNQSALIAMSLGQASGCRAVPDLLTRTRPTPIQGGLNPAQRRRNVSGAFSVTGRHKVRVCDAHIVLVDDVFTTGATISECARVLLRAGAARVDVLTLARVVRS